MSGKYECLMRLEGFKVNIGLFNLLLLVAILSCMDDTFANNTTAKGTFISIRGIDVQSCTHLVNPETYDFVFFANEPYYIPVINQLNYITAYDNLNDIVYSERYSLSEQLIPMIQEVNYQYVA